MADGGGGAGVVSVGVVGVKGPPGAGSDVRGRRADGTDGLYKSVEKRT